MIYYNSETNKIEINKNYIPVDEAEYNKLLEAHSSEIDKGFGEIVYDTKSGKLMYKDILIPLTVFNDGAFYIATSYDDADVQASAREYAKYAKYRDSETTVVWYDRSTGEFKMVEIGDNQYFDWNTHTLITINNNEAIATKKLMELGDLERRLLNEIGIPVEYKGDTLYYPLTSRNMVLLLMPTVDETDITITLYRLQNNKINKYQPIVLSGGEFTIDMLNKLKLDATKLISFAPIIVKEFTDYIHMTYDMHALDNYAEELLSRLQKFKKN